MGSGRMAHSPAHSPKKYEYVYLQYLLLKISKKII